MNNIINNTLNKINIKRVLLSIFTLIPLSLGNYFMIIPLIENIIIIYLEIRNKKIIKDNKKIELLSLITDILGVISSFNSYLLLLFLPSLYIEIKNNIEKIQKYCNVEKNNSRENITVSLNNKSTKKINYSKYNYKIIYKNNNKIKNNKVLVRKKEYK